jgi:PAS domain S-box-containing protein
MTTLHRLRSLFHVVLPVAVASVFIFLAVVNIALVKAWKGEPEDGVLWTQVGANVVAAEVDRFGPAAIAGVERDDVLLTVDGHEIASVRAVQDALHASGDGDRVRYVLERQSAAVPVEVELHPMRLVRPGLYYSVALVGILAIVLGASVRLRRPNDPATLHFFWLTVAFFGALSFTPSGVYDRLDYFFDWADLVARLALPPMFLHFAFVFPERAEPWARTTLRRAVLAMFYAPAVVLGLARVAVTTGRLPRFNPSLALEWIEQLSLIYLALCLLGGLAVMMRALTRLRSVTARRQLRWIVWGSALGALPFVTLYLVPFLFGHVAAGAEFTAVLLGCIPLAFASAIVRYRLMDIEVIIKKVLVAAAVVLLLTLMYAGTLQLISLLPGADQDRSSFLALLATLTVALVAPWMWRAIQAGLDRLYYRDRYDYRRALLSFTRDLNSDLDLSRLSRRLVDRIAETLGIDHIALFLPTADVEKGHFSAYATGGIPREAVRPIVAASALSARLVDGQTVVLDDPVPGRRLTADETAAWRAAGLLSFVPCVSNDLTIGVMAVGRRALGEPLSSEDMSLLAAVAGQAATAIENARLYSQLQEKANEIESVRQFNANVVESLTDALVVVGPDDRVQFWNRRAETLTGVGREAAVGRPLTGLFQRPFLDTVRAARHESPAGTSLFRVPLSPFGEDRRELLVNLAIAPFERADREQAGWILVIADVTDRANLEEQLRLSEKMAAIGLLAAGVAHEVNTPLTGISSFTQMLLDRSDADDPRKELLEKIERQTFRAARIVNNLLNLARPSGGEVRPVDLNGILGDVLSLLEHQLRMSRVQVRRELVDGPVMVRGVEYKLQQVFLNLFLNARDAMPSGGWLAVSTRVEKDDAIVEVSDTGHGIPSEHIARIYDPFFTTKGEGRGTGLGLSVTYGIVQEHAGTLTCESSQGEGTRFRLVLPLVPHAAAAPAGDAPAALQG